MSASRPPLPLLTPMTPIPHAGLPLRGSITLASLYTLIWLTTNFEYSLWTTSSHKQRDVICGQSLNFTPDKHVVDKAFSSVSANLTPNSSFISRTKDVRRLTLTRASPLYRDNSPIVLTTLVLHHGIYRPTPRCKPIFYEGCCLSRNGRRHWHRSNGDPSSRSKWQALSRIAEPYLLTNTSQEQKSI